MARSAGADGGSEAEATTLEFPSKRAWGDLAEAKRISAKRSSSANGTYSKALTKAVRDEHFDRTAAGIVFKLNEIEDDSDLHTTVHHLLDGMVKLGVLERAMIGDDYELFGEHKVGESVKRAKAAAGKKAPAKPGNGAEPAKADATNVKPFPQPSGAAAE